MESKLFTAIKETSTILYTLEKKSGDATTERYLEDIFGLELTGNEATIFVELENEGVSIEVPILPHYRLPYDFAVTDEIGTEHYIYYEEK